MICLPTDKNHERLQNRRQKIQIGNLVKSTMNFPQKRACPCEDSIDLFKFKPSDIREAYLANLEARMLDLADSDFDEESSEESSSDSSENDDEHSEENSCVNQREDKMEISDEEKKTDGDDSNEEDNDDLDSFVVSDDAPISYYSSSEAQ